MLSQESKEFNRKLNIEFRNCEKFDRLIEFCKNSKNCHVDYIDCQFFIKMEKLTRELESLSY